MMLPLKHMMIFLQLMLLPATAGGYREMQRTRLLLPATYVIFRMLSRFAADFLHASAFNESGQPTRHMTRLMSPATVAAAAMPLR